MGEIEPYEGQVLADRSKGYWYGYTIYYDISTAPDDRHYKVAVFRQDYPTEEVRGQEWNIEIRHIAWFQTLDEAKTAAEAFADEMHWQREVEYLGVGRELRKQANEEVLKVANELRDVTEKEPEKLTSRFRYYDEDREWENAASTKPIVRIEASARNEYILVEVMGRTNPTSTDYWDGNWLNTEVTIRAGGFRGYLTGYLFAEDFITFRDELTTLYTTLSGSASLTTMEDWLSMEMIGDGKGHITAKCTVMDEPGMGNTLQFKFELDQTFIPPILESLSELSNLFPVIGNRKTTG
jgi:hypothetical protein